MPAEGDRVWVLFPDPELGDDSFHWAGGTVTLVFEENEGEALVHYDAKHNMCDNVSDFRSETWQLMTPDSTRPPALPE